jgi:cation:H+ antiporter
MPPTTVVMFLGGFVALIWGAELLVRGASRLASAAGISSLVIGLTVVAYGTSAPEIAVTLGSVFSTPPKPELAIGNVVGSNISNVLLVLGISAVFVPLVVSRQLVKYAVPFMIAVSASLWILGRDGQISRVEGAVLLATALLYSVLSIARSRRTTAQLDVKQETQVAKSRAKAFGWNLLLIGIGLLLLIIGANWLVDGAVVVAKMLGVTELIIGLTVVAVGTSLPEIATSLVAGLRGQRDIAVGNVVGSNIFNILLVLGLTALVAPQPVLVPNAAIRFDIPVMFTIALACWPIFFTGWSISRWEGAAFLAYYVAYTLFLYLQATQHEALGGYRFVMLYFIVPLTALVLVILSSRFWHRRHRDRESAADASSAEQRQTPPPAVRVQLSRRLVALISLLVLATAALVYEYSVAQPGIRRASRLLQEASAAATHDMDARGAITPEEVQKLLGQEPNATEEIEHGIMEIYRWRSGFPFRSLDLFVVYKEAENPRLHYVSIYTRPAQDQLPRQATDTEPTDTSDAEE